MRWFFLPKWLPAEPSLAQTYPLQNGTKTAQLETSDALLSPGTLQQLMSSISNTEQGVHNFVPSATPSSLPPSFLDRSATNPLSMLGSMGSGDGPGPSGLNVPNISDSMM